jgi:dihydropteroate synthase
MGILNVTPDSFSDGGLFLDPQAAVDHALEMEATGADIIDIGGESTRPGATPVSEKDELKRILPVLGALIPKVKIPISIDTTKPEVARQAIDMGASIINDVGGLTDEAMLRIVKKSDCGVVIMHARGTPQTMQRHPRYKNVIAEVYSFLKKQIERGTDHGISKTRMVIDPGIGFGKTLNHNLTLLNQLFDFIPLGVPILIGASRKSFIPKVLYPGQTAFGTAGAIEGTAATVAISVLRGARILRVHDVAFMVRVAQIANAILKAPVT